MFRIPSLSKLVLAGVALCAFGFSPPSWAAHDDHPNEADAKASAGALPPTASSSADAAATASRDRIAIQVNGIVCSFCAHGLEKGLSKLDGLDEDLYGNGVLVDIESQLVTLATQPGVALDFAEVHRRIVKSGYEPVRYDFRIRGVAESKGDFWQVVDASTGQTFRLRPDASTSGLIDEGASVDFTVQLDAGEAENLAKGDVIQVRVIAGA